MLQFSVLLGAYALSQFYRSFLAVVAPELAIELGLTASDLGNISAAWFAGFALCQLPVGFALDRFGPRRTLSAVFLSAAAGALLFAFSTRPQHLIAAMTLVGIGCGPVLMSALFVFARMLPPHRFAMQTSLFVGIGSCGNWLSASPLAYAVGVVGWRPAICGLALVTVLSSLLVLLLVRDPPKPALPSHHAADDDWLSGLKQIVTIRDLWPLLPLVTVSYAVVIAERGLWIGPYLTNVWHLASVDRGHVALMMGIAMSAGALSFGPIERIAGTRKWVVFAASVVTGLAFLTLMADARLGLVGSAATLCFIGFAGHSYGILMAHARPMLPDHLLGRGMTFLNFLFMSGAGLLQPLSGHLVDRLAAAGTPPATVYATLHAVLGLTLLTATAIYAFSREPTPSRRTPS